MGCLADTSRVTAIVLGGGNSRRFGAEKGLAHWRGRSLVDHVLMRLPTPRAATLLSLRQEQNAAWTGREDVTIIHDHEAHAGPLRGIIRGLEYVAENHLGTWAWVVACDQPLLNSELLCGLLDAVTSPTQALIPLWENRLQPLTGLYHIKAAAPLRACHEDGEASLVRALETCGHDVFSPEQCRHYDPHGQGFMNVNRRDDLDELERILK